MADATPHFHRATGRFLLVGASMVYQNDEFVPDPRPRHTVWSCMNPADGKWSSYRLLEMPSDPEDTFFSAAAGCAQYLELDNGELLIPFYTMSREAARHPWENSFSAAVMRCSFDGETLRYLEHGPLLSHPVPRGFCEPSVIGYAGRFYLTLRNDEAGYVTVSGDGLRYRPPGGMEIRRRRTARQLLYAAALDYGRRQAAARLHPPRRKQRPWCSGTAPRSLRRKSIRTPCESGGTPNGSRFPNEAPGSETSAARTSAARSPGSSFRSGCKAPVLPDLKT